MSTTRTAARGVCLVIVLAIAATLIPVQAGVGWGSPSRVVSQEASSSRLSLQDSLYQVVELLLPLLPPTLVFTAVP